MRSCSVHHCILFFIFTFTTAPVSASICSLTVKLHQPVTLLCEHMCSSSLKWTLYNNRDIVLARCDQTSCSSEEGYEISHAKYLNGDLSLTITAADYNKRNIYACECGIAEISTVRLSIETVISTIQKKFGEALILNLTIPEPVRVLYKSSDSADDEEICTVDSGSLQCKDKYKHRTLLGYPELTLTHMETGDSGSYTIRDLENNEDIHIYAVSVEDEQGGFPTWGIIIIIIAIIILILLLVVGVVLFCTRSVPYRAFMKLSKQFGSVDQLVKKAQPSTDNNKSRNMTLATLQMANNRLDQLEQQYKEDSKYAEQVSIFCEAKRTELIKYKQQYEGEEGTGLLPINNELQIKRKIEEVGTQLQQLRDIAEKRNQLTSSSSMDEIQENVNKHLEEVENWCRERRVELRELAAETDEAL